MIDIFNKQIKDFNLELYDKQYELIKKFVDQLLKANKNISLVSVHDIETIYLEHVGDSLSFKLLNLEEFNMDSAFSMIDLGSGGGFPAIPISILYPKAKISLVESIHKKALFLETIKNSLNDCNITVLNDRIEFLGQQRLYRGAFDIVTVRALTNLNSLLEYSLPFLKIGGILVAYKTENELNNLNSLDNVLFLLGGRLEKIIDYKLTNKTIPRKLIIFKKTGHTPEIYPRRIGLPVKQPLI